MCAPIPSRHTPRNKSEHHVSSSRSNHTKLHRSAPLIRFNGILFVFQVCPFPGETPSQAVQWQADILLHYAFQCLSPRNKRKKFVDNDHTNLLGGASKAEAGEYTVAINDGYLTDTGGNGASSFTITESFGCSSSSSSSSTATTSANWAHHKHWGHQTEPRTRPFYLRRTKIPRTTSSLRRRLRSGWLRVK